MPDYFKAGFAALAMALAAGPVLIPALRRFKLRQFVREDGPQRHLAKSGTPTMGGILFLLTMPFALLFVERIGRESWLALYLLLTMALVGVSDDYLKTKKRQSEGLSSRQKLMGQMLAALLFSILLWQFQGGWVWLPFLNRYWYMGVYYIPYASFIIVATVNGTNLTDGLDGLCAGVTFLVAFAYALYCWACGLTHVTWFAAALAGSCLGFLMFNLHPARVFMGDTGSLALGGGVAALALLTGTELLLPLLGIVYVSETISVILQVAYFKATGGKRLFRMAPLHHHFELCGLRESVVSVVFWLVTVLAAALFLWIAL